jgi:hypothetical protein
MTSPTSAPKRELRWIPAVPILCALALVGGFGLGHWAGVSQQAPPAVHVVTQPLPVLDYFPTTPADAAELRAHHVSWTNEAIRGHYLKLIQAPALEFVARRAFVIRHNARLTCRAMMENPAEVQQLEQRDLEKYGHPDGPTFDWLVRHYRQAGKCGDEVFEAIIDNSRRTDPQYDARFPPGGK